MRRTLRKDGLALLQHGEQAPAVHIMKAHLAHLPAVAERYLRAAQVVSKEAIRTVRLT